MFKRTLVAALTAFVTVGSAVIAPVTADAAPPAGMTEQMVTLCYSEDVPPNVSFHEQCSIRMEPSQIDPDPVEGTAVSVTVTGNPSVTVPLQAYAQWRRYDPAADRHYTYTVRISDPVNVTPRKVKSTDSYGTAKVAVKLGPLTNRYVGQHIPVDASARVVVQTGDWVTGLSRASQEIGAVHSAWGAASETNIVSKRPQDRGTTVAIDKDGNFQRTLFNAIPTDRFSVQVKVGEKWISADAGQPVAGKGPGLTTLPGRLPKDLRPGTYEMRVVNVTSNITDITDTRFRANSFNWTIRQDSSRWSVYTVPGTWDHNGRKWRTSCEPYSVTERCRTEIIATQITQEGGSFARSTGWVFNNLTYLPSQRSAWSTNELGGLGRVGYEGSWQSGRRQWRVECDTATSGRGGCRSYILASVAQEAPRGGYEVVQKWLFNNIVLFS